MAEHGTEIVMAEQPLRVRPCSIAAALGIVGERWSLQAIREMGYGVHRFAQIAAYTGASRDMLADRLRKLENAGLVERRQYSEHPPRYEYHLTEAGRELFPVLLALQDWGDTWAVAEPAVQLVHECGHPPHAVPTCRHCGAPVTPESVAGFSRLGTAIGEHDRPPDGHRDDGRHRSSREFRYRERLLRTVGHPEGLRDKDAPPRLALAFAAEQFPCTGHRESLQTARLRNRPDG